MSTRSACKCCLSGCYLSPDDIQIHNDRVYYKRLVDTWTEFVQTDPPSEESTVTWPVPEIDSPQQMERYTVFIKKEITKLVAVCFADEGSPSKNVLYFRILFGWMLKIDPRTMLEILTNTLSLFRHFDTQASVLYSEQLSHFLGHFMLGTTEGSEPRAM